jgi:hypothetical protein
MWGVYYADLRELPSYELRTAPPANEGGTSAGGAKAAKPLPATGAGKDKSTT